MDSISKTRADGNGASFNRGVMTIRSAGKDGVYSGDRYEAGTFAPGDTNQDLVWLDGFFVRWPEKDIKGPR